MRVRAMTPTGEVELSATLRLALEHAGHQGGTVRMFAIGDHIADTAGRRVRLGGALLVELVMEHLAACWARDWRLVGRGRSA